MLALVRWVLIGLVAVCLASLLFPRGGLGEYVRGGSLTTARLDACLNDVWHEDSHVTCSATWDDKVEGTVSIHDTSDMQLTKAGESGSPDVVTFPKSDMRVFADGNRAQQADTTLIALGAGALAVFLGLLGWAAYGPIRRRYGAASTRRGAFATSAETGGRE